MSCNWTAIFFREADCHTWPTVSCGLDRDLRRWYNLLWCCVCSAPLSKHFVLDSRFVFKSRLKQPVHISCGHTTRSNSSKIARGKFISGFVLLRWKILERSHSRGHTTDIGSEGFHASCFFWSVNLRRQYVQGSSWSKRRFFFYLTVISYANSTCKVKKGEDVDDSCPANIFHSMSYARFCYQDFRRWASIGQQPRYFIFP